MRRHVGTGWLQHKPVFGWHLSFSSESLTIRLQLAGLLAYLLLTPSRYMCISGFQLILFSGNNSGLQEAYSYGDSAGITPDFPFNHAGREPFAVQKWDFL